MARAFGVQAVFVLVVSVAFGYEPSGGSGQITITKKTTTFGPIQSTEYVVPASNANVVVQESNEKKSISASVGTAGVRTADTHKGGRQAWVTISGPKNTFVYADIDGDGQIDVRENRTKQQSHILVDDRWIEVLPSRLAPEEGDSRTTISKPEIKYTFRDSTWAKY